MNTDVEEVLALVPLDEELAKRSLRRGAHRRMFREMIKGELEAGPLTWRRRRALTKFAKRLEIDRYEAQLLIRGVEYEGAMIPEAALRDWNAADGEDSTDRTSAAIFRLVVLALVMAMYYALIRLGGAISQ